MRNLLYFVLFTIFCSTLFSQTTGKIKGKVFDSFGNPVPGANITIVGTTWGAESDEDGYYYIIGVRAGTYTLRMQMRGFPKLEKRDIKVKVGQTTVQDLKIDVLYPIINSSENCFLTIPDSSELNIKAYSKDSLNIKDQEGFTPLLALFYPNYNFLNKWEPDSLYYTAKKMIRDGADVNVQNNYGVTPLMKVCELGLKDVVELLLKNNANTEKENYLDQTALFYAVKSGNIKTVQLLIEHKANAKVKDQAGKKPVFYAVDFEIMKYLENISDLNKNENYILSVMKNDLAGFEQSIKWININFCFKDKKTALMYACENNNLEITRILINKGIDVSKTDKNGNNALHYFIRSGNTEIVQLLLNTGININQQNNKKETPLILAAKNNNIDVVGALTKYGADASVKDIYDRTAIDWAYFQNNMSIIEAIASLSRESIYRRSIMDWAIEINLINIVKILVENGFDIDTYNEKKQTPLFSAILYKNYSIADFLLKKNANVNISSGLKFSPLIVAVKYSKDSRLNIHSDNIFTQEFKNYTEFVRINNLKLLQPEINIVDSLIKYGADINTDSLVTTPLTSALEVYNFDLANKLISLGANQNAKTLTITPLIASLKSGYLDLSKEMIESGADINLCDNNGYLPIQYLLTHNRNNENLLEYVEYFISKGSETDWVNNTGNSVIMNAVETNNIDVVKYLIRTSAKNKINQIDSRGRTALWFAINKGNQEIITVLLENDADINISKKLSKEQNTYNLFSSALMNSDSMGLYLIEKGIDLNDSRTLLIQAISRRKIETVHKLLELGADPNELDNSGKTAFDHARSNKEILEILNLYKK